MAEDESQAPASQTPEEPVVPGESPAKVPKDNPMMDRVRIAGWVALQIVLVIIIFGQVNYLSCHRYQRWDLSQNRIFTLSDTSRNFLGKLDGDIRVVMAFLGSSDLFSDVKGLISEYERLGGGHITTEVLDLSRNRQRLAELRDQEGIQFTRDMLVIITRNRKKVVGAEELVTRDPRSGRVTDFHGEQALTSALLEVTEKQQKTIYLITGKRRAEEARSIAEQLADLAATQNARVAPLSLEGLPAIPEDADALVLPGNSEDLSEREVALVETFWNEKKGGLLILLDPAADAKNLNTFLRRHGVRPEDDRILSVASIPGMAARRIYDVPVAFLPDSPVTQKMGGLTTQLTGSSQSLTVETDNDLLKAENIHPQRLMAAARNFWGETEYQSENITFNQQQDHAPPIFPAASVEKGAPSDPNLKIRSSRMVVVGNPDLISPSGNTAKANADFALAALNWSISREELIGISPRKPTAFTLSVAPGEFSLLQTLIIFVLPGVAMLLAGLVWYTRRT